jgi:hypothetical protein
MAKRKLRMYVWLERGPRRIAKAAFDEGTKHRFPRLAGTRQRGLEVVYWHDEGGTLQAQISGVYRHFDAEGKIHAPHVQEVGRAIIGSWDADAEKRGPVVDLNRVRKAQLELESVNSRHNWQPSESEFRAIAADLRGEANIPILRGETA